MPLETLPDRYSVHDEYVLEEIRQRFKHGDRDERIRVLEEVYLARPLADRREYPLLQRLPYEHARLFVQDPDPIVRFWLARNARNLDYREEVLDADPEEEVLDADPEKELEHSTRYRFPKRNLWNFLRSDSDSFIRAALNENAHYPPYEYDWVHESDFAALSQLERLALMRNPRLPRLVLTDLVLRILDCDDKSLGLTIEERTQLALAYLTNGSAIEDSRIEWFKGDLFSYSFENERERLWSLVTKFPDSEVRWFGFRYLGGKDKWKAAAYLASSKSTLLRQTLLLNTSESDGETLKLGTEDEDDRCRELAYEKYNPRIAKSIRMAMLGYIWTAFLHFTVVLLVLLLFSQVQTRFERSVIALFVYIYLSLSGSFAEVKRLYRISVLRMDYEFRRVRGLTGESLTPDQRREETQELEAMRRQFSKSDNKFFVHAGFQLVLLVIATYNILIVIVR